MPQPTQEITTRESDRKQLAYTAEFKSFVKDHDGVLKKAQEMIDSLLDGETDSAVEDAGIVVEKILTEKEPSRFFRITLTDKSFFVKMRLRIVGHVNLEEFQVLSRLKELYKDNPKVEIVNFQLAFASKDRNYFVAEWDDRLVMNLRDHLRKLDKNRQQLPNDMALKRHIEDLGSRANEIEQQLRKTGFDDFGSVNMAYDPKTDTIILFDILLKKQR